MIVIIVVKINVPHILSIVFIFKVILAPASDCNNYIHNQPSPYYKYGSYTPSHIGPRW